MDRQTKVLSLHSSDVQILLNVLLEHVVLRPLLSKRPLILEQFAGGEVVGHLVDTVVTSLRLDAVALDTHRARTFTRALREEENIEGHIYDVTQDKKGWFKLTTTDLSTTNFFLHDTRNEADL